MVFLGMVLCWCSCDGVVVMVLLLWCCWCQCQPVIFNVVFVFLLFYVVISLCL